RRQDSTSRLPQEVKESVFTQPQIRIFHRSVQPVGSVNFKRNSTHRHRGQSANIARKPPISDQLLLVWDGLDIKTERNRRIIVPIIDCKLKRSPESWITLDRIKLTVRSIPSKFNHEY